MSFSVRARRTRLDNLSPQFPQDGPAEIFGTRRDDVGFTPKGVAYDLTEKT